MDGPEAKLFNLSEDIGEEKDLSSEHPDKVAELRGEWEAWDMGNIPAKWQPPQNRKRNRNRRGG